MEKEFELYNKRLEQEYMQTPRRERFGETTACKQQHQDFHIRKDMSNFWKELDKRQGLLILNK